MEEGKTCWECGRAMTLKKSKLQKNRYYKCFHCNIMFNPFIRDPEFEADFSYKSVFSPDFQYRTLLHLYLEGCKLTTISSIVKMPIGRIYKAVKELPEFIKDLRKIDSVERSLENEFSTKTFDDLQKYLQCEIHPQFNYRFLCIFLHPDPKSGNFKSSLIKNGRLEKDDLYPFEKSF